MRRRKFIALLGGAVAQEELTTRPAQWSCPPTARKKEAIIGGGLVGRWRHREVSWRWD
jgi:hypothetical protein